MENLNPPVVLLVLGGVCVLAAFFGGMTGTISLPTMGWGGRIGAGIVGFVLIVTGTGLWLWTDLRKDPIKAPPSASPSLSAQSAVPHASIAAGLPVSPAPIRIDPISAPPLCATFSGTGTAPSGNSIWLGVLTDEPKYYFFPVSWNDRKDHWKASNVTLGEASEKEGEPFSILAVTASGVADEALRDGQFSDGVKVLPDGIEIAHTIDIERGGNTKPCSD